MIESKRDYQSLTAWIHMLIAVIALVVCVISLWHAITPWIGLSITAITNGLIAWAKLDLLWSGKS